MSVNKKLHTHTHTHTHTNFSTTLPTVSGVVCNRGRGLRPRCFLLPKGVPSYFRQPQLSCKHCQFWALFLFVFYIDFRRLRFPTEIRPLLVYMYACSNPRTVEWMFMKHYTGECYQTLLRKFNSYLDRTVLCSLYLKTFLLLYVRLLSTSLSIYGTKCVSYKGRR